jgi:hypothetical protein
MMINTIEEFAKSRGMTLYRLHVVTGVSSRTLYRLGKNKGSLPDKGVMDRILSAFPDASPNELIRHTHRSEEARYVCAAR